MATIPFNQSDFQDTAAAAASQPGTPVGQIREPCAAAGRIEAHYDDPWKTPITMAELRITAVDGSIIDEGGRSKGLATFGMQDGMPIDSVRPDLGSHDFTAETTTGITAEIVGDDSIDISSLESAIIADLAAFARQMETAMQPWISEWEKSGWLGLFQSFFTNLWNGAVAWWEGEGDFWASVGEWLSNLPEMAGDLWDDLTEGAKALWENRAEIIALLQDLAEGSVASFESGMEALARALENIPGLEEIAGLLKDLVDQSAEWAGAMIEMATRTRVLSVLGATMLGTMMMIPPNFWSDMVGTVGGYLIPEVIIAILLAIIAFFTAGTGGAALAARIGAFVAKVTSKLSKAGRAGRALLRVFDKLKALTDKMVDLIRKLKRRISERRNGSTGQTTPINRSAAPLRQAYRREVEALADKARDMRAAGNTPEQIARQLHADRRAIGVKYKDLTPPDELERIYARNLEKYGDRLGPTIEYLRGRGKTWEQIIESASRTGGKDLGY